MKAPVKCPCSPLAALHGAPWMRLLLWVEWFECRFSLLCNYFILYDICLTRSVLPDVLDLFMLETGIRQDALFYAFYVFFNKMAVGLALAFSQIALGYGGYRVDMCQQPAVVSHTLRLLVAPAPTVCILLALFFLWRYPIDEKIRKRIKEDVFRFM